jgi:hypothetical protein
VQRLLDQAAEILQDARDMAPAEAVGKFKEAVSLLEAVRPGSERDGLMALAYLRLAQLQKRLSNRPEAERVFMLGYSYARTSREERVRRFAEKLREELESNSMGNES